MQMFPALQDKGRNDEAGSKQTETWNHKHLQDDECGRPGKNVESSSDAVNGGRLLLVHLPTTVATAATASQDETDYGHQNDVQNPNGYTN